LTNQRLTYLAKQARNKEITPEELDELMMLIRSDPTGEVYEQLNEQYKDVLSAGSLQDYDTDYWQTAFHEITGSPKLVAKIHFLRTWWWAAASILIVLGMGTYLLTTSKKADEALAGRSKQVQMNASPGGEKAVLTLADGTNIILDNAANGNLAQQGSAEVVKLSNGQIAYNMQGPAGHEVMLNTMRTPAGGQYQVILPDGTKVWLNAASSITFPTVFIGNKREVSIKGEAYFEVAKNRQKPFIVDINGKSSVEVVGTIFNINSYENESNINTTLLEGSVKITKANQSAMLKPGQQAIIATSGQQPANSPVITVKLNANVDQVVAWKNGLFDFEGLDLRAVMRQLERWYDIRVQYKGPVDNGIYGGKVYRNVNLSDVLEILQKVGGVQFKLEGKTLIVL
jgi:transmembrane sensor